VTSVEFDADKCNINFNPDKMSLTMTVIFATTVSPYEVFERLRTDIVADYLGTLFITVQSLFYLTMPRCFKFDRSIEFVPP